MRVRAFVSLGFTSLAAFTASVAHAAGPAPLETFVVAAKEAPAATRDATARAAIARHVAGADAIELVVARDVALATGEHVVRYAQTHRGLPIAHAGATVTLGADGAAAHVAAAILRDVPATTTPAIDAGVAASIASSRARVQATSADATLGIYPTADGPRLAWVVYPTPSAELLAAPLVVVDALTGEIVVAYDARVGLDQAKVYPTNPVKSPNLMDVVLPVGMGEMTLQNKGIQSLNCIDKKHTKSIMGLMIHTCDLLQTATPDGNGDYLYPPGMDTDPEDTFSEVSMFHHANRAYDFFRAFDPNLDVNPGGPLPTVSNLRIPQGLTTLDIGKLMDVNLPLDPFQNAFFAPSNPLFAAAFGIQGGAMWFGQGPKKDYSYDGDVVYHEFTHSVVNVTLKLAGTPHMDAWGASYSPGAMNEGLADFFSSAIAGDPDVGEYATQDILPGSKAIRTLDNKDACPATIGGEPHQDSTLFSGALWDARKTLSQADQAVFDAAIFKAMNSSPTGDLAYEEFAKLATDAIAASSLGKAGADSLIAAFTAHGVLPKCTRVLEYAGTPVNGPKDLQGIFFAPGTQTTGVSVKAGGFTAGVVQVHLKVPAGSTKLDVSFDEVNVGGGGLLGMMGTPFAPFAITRFAADPIQFKYKPMSLNAGTAGTAMKKSGKGWSVTIDVPAGTTDAFVMVGNAGQMDGGYTALSLDLSGSSTTSSSGAGGAGAGATTGATSSSSGAGGSAATPASSSGCGCSIPDDRSSAAPALALAALLGIAGSRRRRSRKG